MLSRRLALLLDGLRRHGFGVKFHQRARHELARANACSQFHVLAQVKGQLPQLAFVRCSHERFAAAFYSVVATRLLEYFALHLRREHRGIQNRRIRHARLRGCCTLLFCRLQGQHALEPLSYALAERIGAGFRLLLGLLLGLEVLCWQLYHQRGMQVVCVWSDVIPQELKSFAIRWLQTLSPTFPADVADRPPATSAILEQGKDAILAKAEAMSDWSADDVQKAAERHSMFTWGATGPMCDGSVQAVRGEGVYFYGADGQRYLDWNSQAMCVHHGHTPDPSIVSAVKEQMETMCYMYPGISMVPMFLWLKSNSSSIMSFM